MKRLNMAIVSFAHIHAWNYARILSRMEGARLVAIYDDNKSRLMKASQAFGVKEVYDNYEKLLKREDLDAVVVTSENSRHREHAVLAAEAGKHVLCEKPIATSLNDADEIIGAARRHGVKLQIAFVMRYHPATVEVKRLIEEGEIGKVKVITATNHGKYPGGWFGDPELAGGGAIMDHTVHVADLMRWYTSSEVYQVYAVKGDNLRPELKVEDNALISLTFVNGVIGSIDCSWSRPDAWPIWGDVYLAIVGEEGCLFVDAFRSNVTLAGRGGRFEWVYFGPDPDLKMLKDFVRCILEDEEPRATGHDGKQALEVALAAYKAIREGSPVKLPLSY